MLRGSAPARIDEKSRLKVPNAFRTLIEAKYGRELFVTSLTGEYVRLYPMPVWLDSEQRLGAMPSTPCAPPFPRSRQLLPRCRKPRGACCCRAPARCRHDGRRSRRARAIQLSRVWNHERFLTKPQRDPPPTTTRALSRVRDMSEHVRPAPETLGYLRPSAAARSWTTVGWATTRSVRRLPRHGFDRTPARSTQRTRPGGDRVEAGFRLSRLRRDA